MANKDIKEVVRIASLSERAGSAGVAAGNGGKPKKNRKTSKFVEVMNNARLAYQYKLTIQAEGKEPEEKIAKIPVDSLPMKDMSFRPIPFDKLHTEYS